MKALKISVNEEAIGIVNIHKLFKIYGSIAYIICLDSQNYLLKYLDEIASEEAIEELNGSVYRDNSTGKEYILHVHYHQVASL